MWKTLLILGAILYSLSPFDLLPDYIVGWGWLDDIALWVVLWQIFIRMKQRMETLQGRRAAGDDGPDQHRYTNSERRSSKPPSPYEILGVSKHASVDEIKHAHRQLAAQYHPDKVSHLGTEFRELAEKRFKEIQEAYQELSKRKNC